MFGCPGVTLRPTTVFEFRGLLDASLTRHFIFLADGIGQITGRVWGSIHRPRHVADEGNVFEQERLFTGEGQQVLDARKQAIDEGQKDPVQIWADSRYECWWPRERLEAIGLQVRTLPRDGNGGVRHVSGGLQVSRTPPWRGSSNSCDFLMWAA